MTLPPVAITAGKTGMRPAAGNIMTNSLSRTARREKWTPQVKR